MLGSTLWSASRKFDDGVERLVDHLLNRAATDKFLSLSKSWNIEYSSISEDDNVAR